MRKIISILIALGLVLGLSLMATPVSSDTVSKATVSVVTNCAGVKASYNITFNISASLTEGLGKIIIAFPAGTVIPTPVAAWGAVTVNNVPVFGGDVSVNGTTVTVAVPQDLNLGNPISVYFAVVAAPPASWGIINPPAGTYTLKVSTSRPADSTPRDSYQYVIVPLYSTFAFETDWGPSYPGINPFFFPPLKASGQNVTAGVNGTYVNNLTNLATGVTMSGFMNLFNLTFTYVPPAPYLPGCMAPCSNVTIWLELTKAPTNSTVTLNITDPTTLIWTWYALALPYPPYPKFINLGYWSLTAGTTITWPVWIHVDTIGDYELTFHADCVIPPCCAPASVVTVVPFTAYQWKDWAKIPIYRKWNLISLPLVPFNTNINAILAALHPAVRADLLSVWYFDQSATTDPATGTWYSYPGTLTTMQDGRAYWMRFVYNSTNPAGETMPANGMGAAAFPLYVWGTAKGAPTSWPAGPYPVGRGWNMVGLTETAPTLDSIYLWNFWSVGMPLYGQIYRWDAPTQTWVYGNPGTVTMVPTYGYWIPFSVDGAIYP